MIRALLLIFDGSRAWEAIKNDKHSVGRISMTFLLPLLILTSAVEGWAFMRLGIERGSVNINLVKAPLALALRYEAVQAVLTLLIVYIGAIVLRLIGASFHRRHTYTECFCTLAYSISPLLLCRMFDGVPALSSWACFGVGIFLVLSLFYRGIPFILRPDPSNALGLFTICSFLILVVTGLAHYVATLVLEEKILA